MTADRILVIACGALAREIHQLKLANGWHHMTIQAISAQYHNRPMLIPDLLREKIAAAREHFERIFVAYADCGTAGAIDRVLAEENIERLPGPHCYATFAGGEAFAQLAEQEPGTFYLTDFLARHFQRLIIEGLKLDTHPELTEAFFGNYTRLVYLAQTHDTGLVDKARDAAARLDLKFELVPTGYGELQSALQAQMRA